MHEPADNGGSGPLRQGVTPCGSGPLRKRPPLSRVNCSPLFTLGRRDTRSGMENSHNPQPTPDSPKNALPALSARDAAGRANAMKSTGPRTTEGMAVARLNALKHGFFARDVVNPELDGPTRAEEFYSLLDALLEEFQPESARERILVDEVAACCWRVRRLLRYECRESWVDEDAARRSPHIPRPPPKPRAPPGPVRRRARRRTDRKLRRTGLDAFILPSDRDVDKNVRFAGTVKP